MVVSTWLSVQGEMSSTSVADIRQSHFNFDKRYDFPTPDPLLWIFVTDEAHSGVGVYSMCLTVVADETHSSVGVIGAYLTAIAGNLNCRNTYLTVVTYEANSGVGDRKNDMRYFTLRLTSRLEIHKSTQPLKISKCLSICFVKPFMIVFTPPSLCTICCAKDDHCRYR